MAHKPRCPDTPKDKKKTPKLPSSGDRGGSTHAKQKIGLFQVEVMMKCIAEIHKVEADAKRHGKKPKIKKQDLRGIWAQPKHGVEEDDRESQIHGSCTGRC